MAATKRYRCVIQWKHRKFGPQMEKASAEGTSIRRALNHALLGFFSESSSRKLRADAHAELQVQIWRLTAPRPRVRPVPSPSLKRRLTPP